MKRSGMVVGAWVIGLVCGLAPCLFVTAHAEDVAELVNQAKELYQKGLYGDALPVAERAVAVAERQLPDSDFDRFKAYLALGQACLGAGDYGRAAEISARGVAFAEKSPSLGPRHPSIAVPLNNLAEALGALGDLARAEQAARRAIEVSENHPDYGPRHIQTTIAVQCLARVLELKGDYTGAEKLYQRALAAKEAEFGVGSPESGKTLQLLAGLYYEMKAYDRAEEFYQRTLAILDRTPGSRHPITAMTVNNYARLCYVRGDYRKAEELQVKARDTLKAVLGAGHPSLSRMDNNLGELYACTGRVIDAVELFGAASKARVEGLGPFHPLAITSLHNLAFAEVATGDWLAAVGSTDRARHGVRRYVARVLPSLSDREQIQFLKVRDEANLHSALSIGLAKADDPKITSLSAGWLANAKSVGQEAAAERILIAREGNDPAAKKLADELTAVRRQLAALRQSVTAAAESKDILKKIGELEEQERSLIRSLGVAVPWVDKDDPWVGIDAIRRAIPAGTVFVDIARFAVRDFSYAARQGTPYDPFLPSRYAAWIVPPAGAGDVRVIDLGDATRIDELVDGMREVLVAHSEAKGAIATKGEGAAEKELAAAAAPLSQLTIQPMLRAATAALGAAPKELVISADGKLWLVPFAAFPLEDGRYAIEATAIRLITSGRDLVDPAAAERRSAAVGKPLIMAAPDFDSESAGRAANQRSDNRGASLFTLPITAHRLAKVGALPGTLEEAMAVAPSVGRLADARPDVVTGGDATEARFKATPRPIVAILATHGFFRPDQQLDRKLLTSLQGGDGGGRGLADSRGEALENPLTRCGLLFAGCNRANAADAAANATEDGVLTGLEIIGCDLRGTKLVVLSACQTGLGDVEAGQGVAGLRQAFQLAGARSVVATLWSVPDRETAELSSGMFANLADGKTPSDSLRQAQIDMIASRRRLLEAAHPFFWAAFTVTGK